MDDLKQLWDFLYKESENTAGIHTKEIIQENINGIKSVLGLFFWNRGGRQFVERYNKGEFSLMRNAHPEYNLNQLAESSKNSEGYFLEWEAQLALDFLDAWACLGEDKIKELIKKDVKQ